MKAYKIKHCDIDGWGISFGKTTGKARYKAYKSALDVFPTVKLLEFHAARAPDYDKTGADEQHRHGCWNPEALL
jgi:hypothetical protein